MFKAILFDLDGTLLDTAPDMAAALNRVLEEEQMPVLPLEEIRPHVSKGGLALTLLAFANTHSENAIEGLRQRFLSHYLEHIADHSSLFPGFADLLEKLERHGIPWGIVTNKHEWLTTPLLKQISRLEKSQVTVCGDTYAEKKPHPMPLLEAAKQLHIAPEHCLYVGDDPRDITAGKAAGMTTAIAGWGYIQDLSSLDSWQADACHASPVQLSGWIFND